MDNLAFWSFPGRLVLSASQLARANFIFLHGPTSPRLASYFNSLGGYAMGGVQTEVVVQNNRSHPVRVIDMHVIKSCHAPAAGTVFYAPGEGEDTIIGLGFYLDSADTGARIVQNMHVSPTADYFSKYTISINPGAQQVFRFQTRISPALSTVALSCTFRYQATILDGKKQVSQLIGDGRQPFRVSTPVDAGGTHLLARYSVAYVGGPISRAPGGAYVRVDPKTYIGR